MYATCSILPAENELQLAYFLKRHKNFSILEEHKISVAETGFDGFYICVLQKRVEGSSLGV